ncbi:MAG: glycosyl transferase family 1 [Caldiserica bacterium]|nr:MAG: glycosyl transferase family 1 [Caldisericota bacterium]
MLIDKYIPIVGKNVIEEIKLLSSFISGKVIQHINSTAVGGGVAEILNRIMPLFEDLGITAYWDIIRGDTTFFRITKKIHNALHGKDVSLTHRDIEYYLHITEENMKRMRFNGDIIVIHDPQPLGLIEKRNNDGKKWVWRCHVDVAKAKESVWNFLQKYIIKYDKVIFSAPSFSKPLPIEQILIPPSIDPLSDKNKELDEEVINSVLQKYGISKDKPIIAQVSRYDFLKDPLGVIEAYRIVKKSIDCQLVLAGNIATDDPEHDEVLNACKEKAGDDPDIHLLVIDPANNDIEINSLQRAADIILQKSIREGFALTVTEALWKAKPVIASNVGGIPLQIIHKHSGILVHSIEGCAYWIKQLLKNPEYAKKLGENGKEHVRNNFLITRHLRDYLLLYLSLYNSEDIVNL